jgi:hypothetical protein
MKNEWYRPVLIVVVAWLIIDVFLIRSMVTKYNFLLHKKIMKPYSKNEDVIKPKKKTRNTQKDLSAMPREEEPGNQ